ncbi:MAG: hypothetical protein JW762_08560, partial [Dehalococcoidales bacterium]|nr:hypothetical protein [Dehalococcoidales bacterium]
MRRVITGHREGKSVIVYDAEVPTGIGSFGRLLFPIWKAEAVPPIPLKKTDFNVDVNPANFKLGEVFFASGNSPLLQNIFPRRRWGILYIHNV